MSKKRGSGGSSLVGNKRPQSPKFRLMLFLRQLAKNYPLLLKEFANSWYLAQAVIIVDLLINYLVIKNVNYTEIDWSTYMVQVSQIFNQTSKYNFNYTEIEGPTGPLVYPAGHVYIFHILNELTDGGTNIRLAQYLYAAIYMAQITLVYKIYSHKRVNKVPPYMFTLMCFCSYRIHSIYVLRLFNDPIAILFAYGSFYAMLRKKHAFSAFLFSFAVAIKMNILLFAPAYVLICYEEQGFKKAAKNGMVALTTQLVLAAPFLYTNPVGYLSRAFNFGRIFLHEWTVNWRFIDENLFKSPKFSAILLAVHMTLLFFVFWPRWLNMILPRRFNMKVRRDDPITTLFIANFIGVAFSRSLHYQFYIWYYHSLPLLLWTSNSKVMTKLLVLGCIEYAWNEFPSSNFSSILLNLCHVTILIGLLTRFSKRPSENNHETKISRSKSKRRIK